jgi:hypothetical protein
MNKVVFVSNVGVVRMEIGPSPQGLPRCLHRGTDAGNAKTKKKKYKT